MISRHEAEMKLQKDDKIGKGESGLWKKMIRTIRKKVGREKKKKKRRG
jgi:hypothetical protein